MGRSASPTNQRTRGGPVLIHPGGDLWQGGDRGHYYVVSVRASFQVRQRPLALVVVVHISVHEKSVQPEQARTAQLGAQSCVRLVDGTSMRQTTL